jgi:hypothetical protein
MIDLKREHRANHGRLPETRHVVAHVVAGKRSGCAKSWSEWQDLNLRPPRPERHFCGPNAVK